MKIGASASKLDKLSKELEDVLHEIRQIDGFGTFLVGPSESELKELAGSGPIIVLNVSRFRSDAFLLTSAGIRSICLPLLQFSDLLIYTDGFNELSSRDLRRYLEGKQQLKTILEWLWDVAVEPCLRELGITHAPRDDNSWPHVWWVSSGLLAVLPLHAAGYHDDTLSRTCLDRVVSSYVPTVRSLAYAQQNLAKVPNSPTQNVILIPMAKTPSHADLPFVDAEIDHLTELLRKSSKINTTIVSNPRRKELLSTIGNYQIVHFSCHGLASVKNPSESQLLLSDWETDPLTVSDLVFLNTQNSQLAYLSACNTASTKNMGLLDESINLSSAIHLAGYPSVIGTLWSVFDEQSANVAKQLYELMYTDAQTLDSTRSAVCLHTAIRTLREKTTTIPNFRRKVPNDPFVWAPFIHVGV
jgi:hypothetical protein